MAKAATPTPRRRRAPRPPPDAPVGGLPVELVNVRLVHAHVNVDLEAIGAAGDNVAGFLDTESEVVIRPNSLTATLQLRCRIATPDRARVLLDASLRHRLDYTLRSGAAAPGERMARQNALFAVWPFWRAMLADLTGKAGIRTLALPLLAGGSDKLTSGFEQVPPGGSPRASG